MHVIKLEDENYKFVQFFKMKDQNYAVRNKSIKIDEIVYIRRQSLLKTHKF